MKLRFNRSVASAAAGVAVFSIAAALTFAQSAPQGIPRMANGKPDFNGVWDHPRAADLTKNAKACGSGTKGCVHEAPANLSYTAAGMNKWKNGDHYDYTARCLPWGYTRSWGTEYPVELLQSTQRMAVLFESNNLYHVIPTDGSARPKDLDPTWNGTSVGHWEGDTLVVETTGFNDKTYLDTAEHPHGEKLRVIEKFAMIDKDHMSREVTYEDPEMYEQPFVVKETMARMKPGSELMEYVCMENNKDLLEGHLNGTGR